MTQSLSSPSRQGDLPIVRAAKSPDAVQIAEIYGYHVREGRASFELTPPDRTEIAGRIEAVQSAGLPYLVADGGDELLGFAYAGPYRLRPAYRFVVEDSVYVTAEAQGRGLGRILLQAVIDEATAAGRRQMIAVIGDSANAASIRLHRTLGFTEIGRLRSVGWKHDLWLDSVFMQRALGPGDSRPPDR
ncbi:GNAT family N-acetyltransferase [Algihabitans albus]|uniref:GNAT family N-acetyltransferase n=1 Tax=Algihabitans albus TaxID=2164067 RepID=UPI000E5D1605|nr:GNAT family N-acetyltransferase [Algihabitans albus]